MRILVVEDDRSLCDAIAFHLRYEGYDVDTCHDGEDALYFMRQKAHDLVILDRMLPGMDGVNALKAARQEGCGASVIMLTALGTINDRVTGLDAGADDYVVKPFETEELLARVRAIARRPAAWKPEKDALMFADIRFDPLAMTVAGPGGNTTLTKREMQLLEVLIRAEGQTIARDALFLRVWGTDAFVEGGNLDSYIHFLRRRLKSIKSKAKIVTVRGVGFRLESP